MKEAFAYIIGLGAAVMMPIIFTPPYAEVTPQANSRPWIILSTMSWLSYFSASANAASNSSRPCTFVTPPLEPELQDFTKQG